MCEVLKVSRSGYYKWRDRPKSARQERREELTQEVRRVYIESRQLYGSPEDGLPHNERKGNEVSYREKA